VLLGFVFFGKHLLALLHIESGSFYIAGGIMLFIIAFEMLFGRPLHSKTSEKEHSDPASDGGASIAIFPLAIPMLAGPGALTAIILYSSGYYNMDAGLSASEISLMLVISVFLVLLITGLVLRASDIVLKILRETGVSVLERIMGLILAGMSVQFVYDGIVRLGFR